MTQVQKGIYANRTDIHGNPTRELVWYSSREREEKGNREKTDKKQDTDTDSTDQQGLIKFTRPRTSHFTPRREVGQPTRPLPPPRHFAPHPPLRNLTVKPHTKRRSPLGHRLTGDSFSVQQPCELHVWQPSAVTPRQSRASSKSAQISPPTPRSAPGHMRTS